LRATDGEIVQTYVISSPSGSEDEKPSRLTVAPSEAARSAPASAEGARLDNDAVVISICRVLSVPSELCAALMFMRYMAFAGTLGFMVKMLSLDRVKFALSGYVSVSASMWEYGLRSRSTVLWAVIWCEFGC